MLFTGTYVPLCSEQKISLLLESEAPEALSTHATISSKQMRERAAIWDRIMPSIMPTSRV